MKLMKTCARFLRKNGGTLLAIGASVGVVLTASDTGKATIKAEKLAELNTDVHEYDTKEKVNDSPAVECHTRPWRPRPLVCTSATSRQARLSSLRRPCGVGASAPQLVASSPGVSTGASRRPLEWRARSSSRVLVESALATISTLMPGSSASSSCHSGSAPQCW